MASSPVGVYNLAKTSLMENFKTWMKNDTGANMATLLGEFSGGHISWATINPHNKKLGLWKTPTWDFNFFYTS